MNNAYCGKTVINLALYSKTGIYLKYQITISEKGGEIT